jgi:hypothetical protein
LTLLVIRRGERVLKMHAAPSDGDSSTLEPGQAPGPLPGRAARQRLVS